MKQKMTDEELSRRLVRLEVLEDIWGVLLPIALLAGGIAWWITKQALCFLLPLCACFLGVFLIGGTARKKRAALLEEQLGDFFRAERERLFGVDPHPPALTIDVPKLMENGLFSCIREDTVIENAHGGAYRGMPFSAANVTLTHSFEEKMNAEDFMTRTENTFEGIVVLCQTALPLYLPWKEALERESGGKLEGFTYTNGVLAFSLRTRQRFADIERGLSSVKLEPVRQSYLQSLQFLQNVLDVLLDAVASGKENHG